MSKEEKQASSPFLQKRTKKLLLPAAADAAVYIIRNARLVPRAGAKVFCFFFAKKKALLLLLLATPAFAQVSTDDKALDQLKPGPTVQQATPPATPAKPHKRPAPAKPRLTAPKMPVAPPINPVILPPIFAMPPHTPPPPPPIQVSATAAGTATLTPGAGRITFSPGGSDLNPTTLAAVQSVTKQALADPAAIVDITAWAPGTSDDPSSARRLSLDRALAVRAVMIHDGMLSDRIRAVAKGTIDIGKGPPDRADFAIEVAGKK